MVTSFYRSSILFSISVFTMFLLLLGSCTSPNNAGKVKSNLPPETSLANVPPSTNSLDAFDSLYTFGNARVTLSWNGKDNDGFITGYRFRWDSYQMNSNANQFDTTPTSWRTIINTSMSGNIHFSFVPEVISKAPKSIPDVYHYITTLTGSSSDSIALLLDSGKVIVLFGDSVTIAQPSEFSYPNKGSFIFDSRDSINIHRFEIQSIDNFCGICLISLV